MYELPLTASDYVFNSGYTFVDPFFCTILCFKELSLVDNSHQIVELLLRDPNTVLCYSSSSEGNNGEYLSLHLYGNSPSDLEQKLSELLTDLENSPLLSGSIVVQSSDTTRKSPGRTFLGIHKYTTDDETSSFFLFALPHLLIPPKRQIPEILPLATSHQPSADGTDNVQISPLPSSRIIDLIRKYSWDIHQNSGNTIQIEKKGISIDLPFDYMDEVSEF
ncbi:MAG: hypothetical protein ACXAE3_09005 [Candidatus Kariarchaeaceae archaeon]